jgi:hypothetical protein
MWRFVVNSEQHRMHTDVRIDLGGFMRIANVTVFCKLLTCPSAETLLAYSRKILGPQCSEVVLDHLGICDFCAAELQLLKDHSSESELECPISEIPADLRFLAESILARKNRTSALAFDSGFEKVPVSLTDA